MFTYEEAYRRYTQTFTRRQLMPNDTGELISTLIAPQSPCNHKELDRIFQMANDWGEVLQIMDMHVGSPGPRKDRGDISSVVAYHELINPPKQERFIPEAPCHFIHMNKVVPFIFTDNVGEPCIRFEQE